MPEVPQGHLSEALGRTALGVSVSPMPRGCGGTWEPRNAY